MSIFITGGTGFIGRGIIAKICRDPSFEKIFVLVRASSQQIARERIETLLKNIFPPHLVEKFRNRVFAIQGDLLQNPIVTNQNDLETLKQNVTHILHIGASTDFGAPLDFSRENNVEGTRKVLDIAVDFKQNGKLQRLDYVSTAFVAGRTKGIVAENILERNQSFSNVYEQTKYEAEILVREYMNQLPIAIHRPSIVVGDSQTGFTPHFKVLYWPLRLLSKPIVRFCFLNLNYKIDVVPCDFVSNAISHLLLDDSAIGKTFHLTSGLGNEVRMGQVLEDAYQFTSMERKKAYPFWLKYILQWKWLRPFVNQDFWEVYQLVRPYEFYLKGVKVRFSNEETLRHLEKFNIQPPQWKDYRKVVLSFCTDSSWGRRLPQPEYYYYKTLWEDL